MVTLKSFSWSFLITSSLLLLLSLKIDYSNGQEEPRVTLLELNDLKDSIDSQLMANKSLIPGIIRLAFTDCIGICDGCINKDLDGNRGLEDVVNAWEPLMANWSSSRADLWAVAAQQAVLYSMKLNNEYCVGLNITTHQHVDYLKCHTPLKTFKTKLGRLDCDGGPFTDEATDLPMTNWTVAELKPWFYKHFRLNGKKSIALMGAHSLGGVQRDDLNQTWIPDNRYGLNGRQFYNKLIHNDVSWNLTSGAYNNGEEYYISSYQNETCFAFSSDMAMTRDSSIWRSKNQKEFEMIDSRKWGWKAKKKRRDIVSHYARGRGNWAKDFVKSFDTVLLSGYNLFTL